MVLGWKTTRQCDNDLLVLDKSITITIRLRELMHIQLYALLYQCMIAFETSMSCHVAAGCDGEGNINA